MRSALTTPTGSSISLVDSFASQQGFLYTMLPNYHNFYSVYPPSFVWQNNTMGRCGSKCHIVCHSSDRLGSEKGITSDR